MLLEIAGVRKAYGGLVALGGVALGAERGEILGLIGPNGSGKSTLFNIISGQVSPDGGSVRLDGHELVGLPAHAICRLGVGRTFQLLSPFPYLSLTENVAVGLRFGDPDARRAARAVTAEAECLLHFVGLGAKMLSPAFALSLGELKRLEVAMALSTRPHLLLLDEILAGASPAGIEQVLGLLRRLRDQGLTMLVIEHRLKALARVADRMVALDQGAVVADGSPGDVVRAPAVVAAYMGERK
ncbi:MAG TPA: ABC transporter ATP-binding protein [Candidatus Sulfotelmatobacter sp.]|nr:ABC transporter ATP-binding protein [Candidatus Sulfotelmatobacter sp.]